MAAPDMRAMLFEAAGRPLREARVEVPAPGPGQVRIRVEACGLCWPSPLRCPCVPKWNCSASKERTKLSNVCAEGESGEQQYWCLTVFPLEMTSVAGRSALVKGVSVCPSVRWSHIR
ncbi:MAG: hypothetical protein A2133_04830 [Actinobacteria bacterium RBG_16_64_13]|nr:MAG: hypothetical protein A2133_04830 [Actinobacteria bacterium RBG_16_64_13]